MEGRLCYGEVICGLTDWGYPFCSQNEMQLTMHGMAPQDQVEIQFQ